MSDRSSWRRDPTTSNVVRRAQAHGERAARSGQYDEWSFGDGGTIPYFARLAAEEAKAVAREREHLTRRLRQIDEVQLVDEEQRMETRERAEVAVTSARHHMDLNREQRNRTLRELDLLTGWHDTLPPGHVVGDGYAGDRDAQETDTAPDRPVRRRWMGPADGTLAPPIPRLLKIFLVLLLAAIEVPIHYAIFQAFHPRNPVMTWCFTLPVALCMVLGPHLTGIWLRKRLAVPSVGAIPLIGAAVLMAVWSGAAVLLADLRGETLVANVEVDGVVIESSVSHLGQGTLTTVFALLILLSGLISFMLGIAENHPGVSAFQAAARKAEAAERDYLRTVTAHAGASLDVATPRADACVNAREQCGHRIDSIRADYRAARAAYLDAVSLAIGNPSLTHAVAAVTPRDEVSSTPAPGSRSPGRPAAPTEPPPS